jgi:hypothetical protein
MRTYDGQDQPRVSQGRLRVSPLDIPEFVSQTREDKMLNSGILFCDFREGIGRWQLWKAGSRFLSISFAAGTRYFFVS